MQQVPTVPDWVHRDFSSFVSALRYFAVKGRDKALIFQTNVLDKIKQIASDFEVVEWLSVEGLVYVTLLVVILSSMLIISLNVYRRIRYAIPARVNCWFCNTNTKVLYTLKDTWTCPNCHQYNGFTADGHYNKRIPAQFIEALNRPVRGGPAKGYQPDKYSSNGLCSQCNLNQVLKVFQLASFVPVNERNFDVEVEAEQKRLEQLYGICSQCNTVIENALKRKPTVDKEDKEETASVQNKVQINRVTPTPVYQKELKRTNQLSDDSELSMLHDDCFKDVSESSDNSGDSFLSLDNLKIGSRTKNKILTNFHTPYSISSPSPGSISSLSPQPCTSLMYDRHPSMFGSSTHLDQNSTPLWKDYPFVQGRTSPAYSVTDTINCPVGRPAYVAYNASSPSQFSYQSSNIGGVFGGRKPLISPPKFSNNNAPLFSPFIRYGAYYDISASPVSVPVGHNHNNAVIFNPHYFTNPISRSSSQSSGFVSQHGGAPLSAQSQEQTPNGFCSGA